MTAGSTTFWTRATRPRNVRVVSTPTGQPCPSSARGESLEQRFSHEVPDPSNAFESALAESDMLGGDDPDAIAAEDDFLGDGEVGSRRSGRLMAPDEGTYEDVDSEMVADDMGIDGGGSSAEEAAVHIIDNEQRWDED